MDTIELSRLTADRPRDRRFTLDLTTELFADWQSSGLSLAAFARALGFDVKRLYGWRQRLRQLQHDSMELAEVRVVSESRLSGVLVVCCPMGSALRSRLIGMHQRLRRFVEACRAELWESLPDDN